MAAQTEIGWTDSTHNHWLGCTKISPACENCYAEALMDKRMHRAKWGAGKPRVLTSNANRRKPLLWNLAPFYECSSCGWRGEKPMSRGPESIGSGPYCDCGSTLSLDLARRRVFCSSLADVFDNEVPAEWLADLLDLIRRTPNLDWLLLTKRIGNWRGRLKAALASISGVGETIALRDWIENWLNGIPPNNVQIGATICNQAEADRDVPKLLRVPAAVRFLSIEPMLGAINFRWCPYAHQADAENYREYLERTGGVNEYESLKGIGWIIVGGESGANARPMHPDWARSLRDQCAAAGVPFMFKQWGEWAPSAHLLATGETAYSVASTKLYGIGQGRSMQRIGKKAAGRLLDGVIHNEFPKVRHG